MAGTLYLLDGMALAYRAHFALIRNPVRTSQGFNTSALFGFTATLIELISSRSPSHLAIVFDTGAPTERHRMHEAYKANREEMPEDLADAMPHLPRIADAFGIPVMEKDGYEADDIIGTLAHRAVEHGFDEVFMVTPDKDFGQLVTDRVKMYRPSRQGDNPEVLGPEEVRAKWGVDRVDQVVDMIGLCGDASDNIPGVPGIGPKTAAKLLAQYGTVDDLLDHLDELKGKQRENLETYADQARLSKRLATIQLDVPFSVDWERLELASANPDRVAPLFAEFEFRSLGKRIFGDAFSARDAATQANPGASDADGQMELGGGLREMRRLHDIDADYRIADTAEAREALARELSASGGFAFDTETSLLNPRHAKLAGLSFAVRPRHGWFAPMPDDPREAAAALETFREVFENPAVPKTGHNLKFDLAVLAEHGIGVRGETFDTMLAHALIDPQQRHSLDRLAEDYLDYSPVPFEELFPAVKKGEPVDFSRTDPRTLANYAIEDADVAGQLRTRFEPLLREHGHQRVFEAIETPLLPALVRMERAGIRLDPETLAETSAQLAERIAEIEHAIFRAAGREFNLNSPKQLGEVLFEELKLTDKPKKTRTGQYATDEQVLASLASRHPIAARILEHRGMAKLKNTYVDPLPNAIDPKTGRIHTHYGQLQTATGRLSSNDPNLQNIPVRTEQGREVRRAFVPRDGWRLLSADYSQIELRILAALSGDAGLLEAFREGRDVHAATAARVFGVRTEDVAREQRSTAKMVNFGIPYGISAFGLAQRLGTVSRTEAQTIIDTYFEQFPGIPAYMEGVKEQARANGYVETVTGRRRHLPDIHSANGPVRAAAERNAINMPIQGAAADMIKLAMIRIDRRIEDQGLNSRMLLQVHDELVFDMDPAEEDALRAIVEDGMTNALELDCPVEIEMGAGSNWLEAH